MYETRLWCWLCIIVICIIRRLSCVCWGETQWEDSVGTARWCSVVLSRWWGYYYHHNPAQIWSATTIPTIPTLNLVLDLCIGHRPSQPRYGYGPGALIKCVIILSINTVYSYFQNSEYDFLKTTIFRSGRISSVYIVGGLLWVVVGHTFLNLWILSVLECWSVLVCWNVLEC